MIKLFMLPSWSGDENHMRNLFIRQTPNSSGIWKTIQVVENMEDADFHVQMDKPENGIEYPEKTIYMNWEPPVKKGHYLCNDYNVFGRILISERFFPSIWFLDYTYDELKDMKPMIKSRKVSCVLSSKRKCKGHYIRHKFAKKMCEDHYGDFRLYGSVKDLKEFKGFDIPSANKVTKLGRRGNFVDKSDNLRDYKYHLTMENCQYKNYFTEKITDSLLMWSMPIYWGCPNIDNFLPKECMIKFNAKDLSESKRIMSISNDDLYEGSLEYIGKARDLILDKYNFCNAIWEFLQ